MEVDGEECEESCEEESEQTYEEEEPMEWVSIATGSVFILPNWPFLDRNESFSTNENHTSDEFYHDESSPTSPGSASASSRVFRTFGGRLRAISEPRIVVIEDDTNRILMNTLVRSNHNYNHQKKLIVTWTPGDAQSPHLLKGLSFQHAHTALALWCFVTLSVAPALVNPLARRRSCFEMFGTPAEAMRATDISLHYPFLFASREEVDKMEKVFQDPAAYPPLPDSDQLANIFKRQDVLNNLFALASDALIHANYKFCSSLLFVVKRLLVMCCGNSEAMAHVANEVNWEPVLRMFERDENVLISNGSPLAHVDYFRFRRRPPDVFGSPILSEFHQRVEFQYRMLFLKDVLIGRYLDEINVGRVCSMLFQNSGAILRVLSGHTSTVFPALRCLIRTDYMGGLFFRELCLLLRTMQPDFRFQLLHCIRAYHLVSEIGQYIINPETSPAIGKWKTISAPKATSARWAAKAREEAVAQLIQTGKMSPDALRLSLRPNPLDESCSGIIDPPTLVVEVLIVLLDTHPQTVRSAIFNDTHSHPQRKSKLLIAICDLLEESDNQGTQAQVRELLIKLVTTVGLELPERDEITTLYYDRGIVDRLVGIVSKHLTQETQQQGAGAARLHSAKCFAIEILTHLVTQHRHRIKMRIQQQKVPLRVVLCCLVPSFDKLLAIYSMKFLKACIHLKDCFVDKQLRQYGVMRVVVWLLSEKCRPATCRSEGSLLEAICLDVLNASSSSAILLEWMFSDAPTHRWLARLSKHAACTTHSACYLRLADAAAHAAQMAVVPSTPTDRVSDFGEALDFADRWFEQDDDDDDDEDETQEDMDGEHDHLYPWSDAGRNNRTGRAATIRQLNAHTTRGAAANCGLMVRSNRNPAITSLVEGYDDEEDQDQDDDIEPDAEHDTQQLGHEREAFDRDNNLSQHKYQFNHDGTSFALKTRSVSPPMAAFFHQPTAARASPRQGPARISLNIRSTRDAVPAEDSSSFSSSFSSSSEAACGAAISSGEASEPASGTQVESQPAPAALS
eukprot:GHVT01101462.1.p1 GENE.GHVT01101462.1~~GHVT01101462.1.p1  ORF type:complete len:1103 (+),score=270.24 GHVT01101462.1:251-3310(+)